VLHFGMTGFLKYFKKTDQAPGHLRLRVEFDNSYRLAYDCSDGKKHPEAPEEQSPDGWPALWRSAPERQAGRH
jgi:hypothetical protein